MVKKILLLIISISFFLSCGDNVDCSMVSCAAGDIIRLEFVSNEENVINNGTYTEENITVTGDITEDLDVQVFSETQGATEGLLEINNFDWRPGEYAYTIRLGNDWEIDLEVTFSLSGNDPCCGNRLIITDLSAGAFQLEQTTFSSFYTIILE
ncbi:hypothetical protein [Lentiprolixibacter aurantiacus]|uniref:DUF4249 family protein n=1 Tax=Lentiprolixibacter aurantiacus TaxID=2993939 RepID=A0AAE3SM27_9FLAO|nr:hypothetical protein [Lentiprolixibacter aurantiacus]MCX2718005.1 hypothetical protein [Lentiprolixibacter aurantiacus]